jgi:hypothetical protein
MIGDYVAIGIKNDGRLIIVPPREGSGGVDLEAVENYVSSEPLPVGLTSA